MHASPLDRLAVTVVVLGLLMAGLAVGLWVIECATAWVIQALP